jgi:hypothetical protein
MICWFRTDILRLTTQIVLCSVSFGHLRERKGQNNQQTLNERAKGALCRRLEIEEELNSIPTRQFNHEGVKGLTPGGIRKKN